MAFTSKPPSSKPSKALRQKTPLKSKTALKSKATLKANSSPNTLAPNRPPSPADQKLALQKATLRLLEKARREAAEQGIDLSAWEAEFLKDVSGRVKTYGRAFADPDKGALGGTLSLLQGLKLKEIRKKIKIRAAKAEPDKGT